MILRLTKKKNRGKLFKKKKTLKYVIFWKEKTYNAHSIRKKHSKKGKIFNRGYNYILKKRSDVIRVRNYTHFHLHIIFIIIWHAWLFKLYLIHEEWKKYFGYIMHVVDSVFCY